MIPVALYHCLYVTLRPFIKIYRIVILILLCSPAIECLIYDHQSLLVTGIQKSFRRRIVRRSDSIEAGRPEQFNPSFFRPVISCCSQTAIVMVYTASIDLYRLIVECKAFFGRKCYAAYTELGVYLIQKLVFFCNLYPGFIEMWSSRRPQLWFR